MKEMKKKGVYKIQRSNATLPCGSFWKSRTTIFFLCDRQQRDLLFKNTKDNESKLIGKLIGILIGLVAPESEEAKKI